MTVGIIGLGAMGLGIAQVFAQAGQNVRATDANADARVSAIGRLTRSLDARVAKGAMTAETRAAILGRLQICERIEDLAPTDLVIEAVVERLDVKQAVFQALEGLLSSDAVLATNTSSLSVAAIANGLSRPERLLGLHFFNPAPAMRLVELVPHPATAPDALAMARSMTEAAGKTVIQCADRPGFIVNRCARPYYGEALALLEAGHEAGAIDAAMTAAGYPVGPFALIDLVGADINLAATEGLSAAMNHHPRYHVFRALAAQVARGDLGRKTGKGFVFPDPPAPVPADAEAIQLRIEATVVNEAGWLLAEGGSTAAGIDTAMRLGLNFPRGPFAMLERHGHAAVVETLARLQAAAPPYLKGRYLPAPILAR